MNFPPGQITTAVPFFNSGEGLNTVRVGQGHIGDDVCVPDFGKVLLLRVILLR